jgi:hypothetical protein
VPVRRYCSFEHIRRHPFRSPLPTLCQPQSWRWAAIILSTVIVVWGLIYAFTNPGVVTETLISLTEAYECPLIR